MSDETTPLTQSAGALEAVVDASVGTDVVPAATAGAPAAATAAAGAGAGAEAGAGAGAGDVAGAGAGDVAGSGAGAGGSNWEIAAEKTAAGAKAAAAYGQKAAVQVYGGAKVAGIATAAFTAKHVGNVKEFVMDGPVPFRVLAFAGGCAVLGCSIRDMVADVVFTDIFQTFASVFNVVFGIVIILLESSAVFKKTPWRRELYTNCAYLKTTFGRGVFYLFIGTNMGAQNFSPFSFYTGIYIIFLGFVAIMVGWWTQRKLSKLRDALRDEEAVEAAFRETDKNENGSLDAEEFAQLCGSLGVPMKKVQLMAVFDVIDTSDVGVKKNNITLEEFKTWWANWDDLTEVV